MNLSSATLSRSVLAAVIVYTSSCWFGSVAFAQLSSPDHKYHPWMPPTDDAELVALFDDPSVDWYTRDEIPAVYQHNLGGHSWIDIHKKISPDYSRRISNGNREWPWDKPATTDRSVRVRNIVGVKNAGFETFPTRFTKYGLTNYHDGRGWTNPQPRGSEPGVGWQFTPGTEFVELVTTLIDGYDYTFKVHRMTLTEENEWFFRVYRPVQSLSDYRAVTGTNVGPPKLRTLRDNHSMPAFNRQAWQHEITEPIEPDHAAEILQRVYFRLCKDDDFIPTTKHPNQIYPVGYTGAFLGNATNQANCRNCHRDVAVNVGKFDVGDWYGQIRGGGHDKHGVGVFSWRPKLRTWYGKGERRR